ncbi:hypothetical protein GCM10017708_38390 [Arthrobacter citreus]
MTEKGCTRQARCNVGDESGCGQRQQSALAVTGNDDGPRTFRECARRMRLRVAASVSSRR